VIALPCSTPPDRERLQAEERYRAAHIQLSCAQEELREAEIEYNAASNNLARLEHNRG
jgi:hypothetical protein